MKAKLSSNALNILAVTLALSLSSPLAVNAVAQVAGQANELSSQLPRSFVITPEAIEPVGLIIYDAFDDELLPDWELAEGARLGSEGRDQMLQVSGMAEAVWNSVSAENYTLVFRYLPGRGSGNVILQRSVEPRRSHQYQLRLDHSIIRLVRFAGREEQELGSAVLRLNQDEWYHLSVHSLGGWMRVVIDGIEVLTVVDPQPLPAGVVAFSSRGDHEVAYSDIRLSRWTAAHADDIRRFIERRAAEPQPVPPKPPEYKLPPQVVPLKVATYSVPEALYPMHRIDPGPIPPNFVHTWILDLKDIDAFKLYFKSLADIQLAKDDSILVHNSESILKGQPLASIKVTTKEDKLTIDISNAKYDQVKGGKSYRRVYLQLETSSLYRPRRFVLSGLLNAKQNTGSEEALVVADDINYASKYYITETVDSKGYKVKIPSPWSKLPLSGPPYPRPKEQDGWYQVGQYLADKGQGFFALAYYNERVSLLRLYLYRFSLPNATVYSVRVSLLGRSYKQYPGYGKEWIDLYDELKGAFFPVGINPNKWFSTTIPLKAWSPGCWVLVEVPMLYPMAEKLPAAKVANPPGVPEYYYRSVYEDALQKGRRNILLQVEVGSFLKGSLQGDFVGKAIGSAIQTMNTSGGPSAMDIAKSTWDAIKTGKEYYEGAEKFHGEAKKFYDQKKQEGGPAMSDPSMKVLGALVSLGASAWAGPVGVAGAAFALLSSFLLDNSSEPLQLSLELSLQGSLTGVVSIQYQPRRCWFYLPGRFSISEAMEDGLPIDDARLTESFLPRYDRTMGLFGYRYNPGNVKFRAIRWDYASTSGYADFVYPAVPNPDSKWLAKSGFLGFQPDYKPYAVQQIDRLLPVIYNQYAEITPMEPIVVATDTYKDDLAKQFPFWFAPSRWWDRYKWHFDISWKTHITAELDDTTFPHNVTLHSYDGPRMYVKVFGGDVVFPAGLWTHSEVMPEGMLLQVWPKTGYVPSTYQKFKDIKNVAVHNWCDPGYSYPPKSFDKKDPNPLYDVIYYWDLPYFYYGRSRKDKGFVPRSMETAHFRSPVTIEMTRYVYPGVAGSFNPGEQYDVESRLLVH